MKRHGSMNHIYRLVWSQVTNTWVAVAETARGRGKGSGRQRKKLVAAALALTAVTFASPYAQAGPTGGQVVSGAGTITQTGTLTTIKQNSQNLSLNWSTFNIAPQETVDFVQPSTNSVAVNRIFDTNGTSILGHLNANGQVYLINPNGIVFGAGAQVNVGGLVASTLDLSNSSGTARTFSGSGTGSVVNQGTINAASGGSVALLGNHVSNQGTITAQLGAVALGAGNAVTLTFNGNDLVHMQVNQSVLNSLAENGGLIRADGGTVVMNAGAANTLLASVVNNTGVIEARTVNQQEGSITLLGGMTAGTTNVGGTLDASAPNGGNGGSVTTNAANVIIGNDAKVTTASTSGLAGSWLIDPTNFTISAGSGVQTTSGIGATTLQTNLGLGNVSITTSAAANGSDLGDINVNAPVTWSANQLTLTAAHDVDINAVMTANNTAALTLTPGGNVNVGFNSAGGFSGQVNFFAADGTTPRSGTGFLTINEIGYTVLTSLSALQGMGTSGNYALGTDITGGSFTPIGTNGAPFTGHFDGLGHTISGLIPTNEASTGTGLFGGLSGVVQNVGLAGGSVTVNGSNYTGSLVGANYGTIRNSYSSATVTASNNSIFVGGLVGYQYGGTITNSYASGTVAGGSNSTYVGGLVGNNVGGTISTSHAIGSVTGSSYNVGGLVGQNKGGTISNSYATGNVSGSTNVGGLVGFSQASGAANSTISNSYATGSVSGTVGVGGLVGANYGSTYGAFTSTISNSYATGGTVNGTSEVGGLVGINAGNYGGGTISNSYSTGAITGTTHVGGLVGTNTANTANPNNSVTYTGTVSNSFWDTTTSGQSSSAGGKGMSTSNMQTQANFTSSTTANGSVNPGWNFATSWVMYSGTYPLLTAFLTPLTITANNVSTTYTGLTYSGAGEGVTYSVTPNLSFLSGSASYSGNSQSAVNVSGSPYVITPGGFSSTSQQGYLITYVNGSLTVTPAPLTVTGLSGTGRAYNGSTVDALTGTGVLSGLMNSETLTLSNAASGTLASANAGSEAVTTALGLVSGTGLASNYSLTQPTLANVTITQAPLTVTGLSGTGRTYNGSTVDALSGTGVLSGLVNSETLTLSNAASGTLASANAGSEAVTTALGLVSGTGLAANYSLTQPTLANVTITQAPLTVTGLSGTGRTYNGSTVDALSGAGVLSGLVNSETLTLSNAASGTLASANAGSEAVTAALGLVSGTGLAANYSLTQPTLSNVTITQAPLTVTGLSGTGRTYNSSTVDALTGTGVLSGLVNSETLTLSNAASGTLASANAGSEAVTSALGLVSGTGLAANYSLTQPTLANVTITQAPLTVTGLSGTGRTYNGSTVDALTGTGVLSGLVNSETLTLSNAASGTLASANAGSEAVTAALGLVSGTGLAANYSLTQPTLSNVTITQAPLTVTGLSGTGRTYNGSTVDALTGTGVLSGLVNSETLTLSNAASGTLASANAGSEAVTTALGLVSGTGLAANYSLTQPTLANVTITQAPLTVTGLSGTGRTYNGSTVDALTGTGVLSGLVNSETLTLSNAASGTLASANAGSEAVTTALGLVSGTGLAANYTLTQPTLANVTITQAPLTVSTGNVTKTYDGGLTALGSASVTSGALFSTDTLSGGSFAFTNPNAGNGNKTVTVSGVTVNDGNSGGNYDVTYANNSTSTINQAPLTVTGLSGTGRSYNGSTVDALSGTAVLSGLVNSETLTLSNAASGTLASANAGSEAVTTAVGLVNGTGLAANYTLTQPTLVNVTITQAPLTVSTGNVTKTYDGGLTALGSASVTSGALFSTDTLSGGSFAFTNPNAGNGNKTVTVSGVTVNDGNSGGNYDVTYANNTTSTINQAPLTVTGLSGTGRSYNGSTVDALSGTAVLSGLVNSETLTLSNAASGTLASANAGSEAVTTAVGLVNGTGLAANYTLTQPTLANVTITQAPLTVSTGNVTKTYDGGLTALGSASVTSGALFSTDTLSGGSFAFTNPNAGNGNKTVTVSGVTVNDGNSGGNYDITYANNTTSTINQAPLTVTGLSGTGRSYNGSTVDALSGTAVLSGLVNSETLTTGGSGTLASANAGSEAVSAAVVLVNGTGLASNYSLTQPTLANVTITQAPLTVTGLSGTGRAYNGSTVDALTGTGVLSGLVNSETLTLSNAASGTLASANAGSEAVTTALGLVSGTGLAANYSLTQPTLSNVTITQAPLTVTGLAGTGRTYNGSTVDALTGTGVLSGLVNSETLTLSNAASGTLASANAGSEAVTTALGLVSGTGLASNYSLTQPTLANVTITQAPLTVTGLSGTGRTYNGSTVDALSGTGVLSGLVNSETLTLSNAASGTLASANAGSEAVTTALGLVSGTGLAANYSLTQPTLANVTITQAPLTVTGLSGTGRTYNGSTVDALTGTGVLSGLVNSETLTLSNAASGTLASANAGSEAVTAALGLVSGTGLAANYSLTQPTLANVTITQAPLTVTGLSGTGRTYNGSTVDALSGTGVLSGLVNSETLTLSNAASGTLASANAGSEAVTSALGLVSGTGLAANYSLTQPTLANVTITQAPLTVTGLSGTGRTYNGSTVDALTGTGVLSGLVNSETLTLSNAASGTLASANAGSEAVTAALGLVSGTGLAANYSLTQPTLANVTIAPAPLTVTLTNSGVSKTYNGNVNAPTGFTPTYSFSGLIAGDTGATVTDTTASYNSAHVVSANELTVSGLSLSGVIGSNGSLANDYMLIANSANVAATITAAPLTASAAIAGTTTKVFDGTTAATGATVSGSITSAAIAGDTLALNTSGISLNYNSSQTSASTISATGSASLSIASSDSGSLTSDYALTQPVIAPVAGTITAASTPIPPTPPTTTPAPTIPSPVLIVFQPSTQPVAAPSLPSTGEQQLTAGANNNFDANPAAGVYPAAGASSAVGANTADGTSPAVNANSTAPAGVVVNTTINIAPGVELHLVKGGVRLPDNLVSVN